MRCGSDIGKRCVAAELDRKGSEGVSPDSNHIFILTMRRIADSILGKILTNTIMHIIVFNLFTQRD